MATAGEGRVSQSPTERQSPSLGPPPPWPVSTPAEDAAAWAEAVSDQFADVPDDGCTLEPDAVLELAEAINRRRL